ncbi:hypothetical protein Tco_0360874 [Tanacetum coccineum]
MSTYVRMRQIYVVSLYGVVGGSCDSGGGGACYDGIVGETFAPQRSRNADCLPQRTETGRIPCFRCMEPNEMQWKVSSIPIAFVLPGREHECNE